MQPSLAKLGDGVLNGDSSPSGAIFIYQLKKTGCLGPAECLSNMVYKRRPLQTLKAAATQWADLRFPWGARLVLFSGKW